MENETPKTVAPRVDRPPRTDRPERGGERGERGGYGSRGPRSMDRGMGDRDGGMGPGGRRFGQQMRRVCPFCADANKKIDYKDGDALRRYLNDRGKIKPRRKIGTCARHQRRLTLAIKRARVLALLTYAPPHIHGM